MLNIENCHWKTYPNLKPPQFASGGERLWKKSGCGVYEDINCCWRRKFGIGQAAVFLAQTAKQVYVLVRSASLASSMSRYLIRRIEESPNIIVRPHTEIITLEGDHQLDSVRWRNNQSGETEKHNIQHIFIMTGADPNTAWLSGCLVLDAKGFIKTGPDLSPENLRATGWSLKRQPYLLETSLPGVFAAGDVRGGSIKHLSLCCWRGINSNLICS